jgi:hypothetical protein
VMAAASATSGAGGQRLPAWLDPLPIIALLLLLSLLLFLARLLYFALRKTPFPSRGRPVKTMVVLGSGEKGRLGGGTIRDARTPLFAADGARVPATPTPTADLPRSPKPTQTRPKPL